MSPDEEEQTEEAPAAEPVAEAEQPAAAEPAAEEQRAAAEPAAEAEQPPAAEPVAEAEQPAAEAEQPAPAAAAPAPAARPAPSAAAPTRYAPGEGPAPRRSAPRDRDDDRGGRRRFGRRRVCTFCVDKVKSIDYKDAGKLRRYISDRGRIEARRRSGTCAKHQRWLATALKRARHLALLPYSPEHIRLSGQSMSRR